VRIPFLKRLKLVIVRWHIKSDSSVVKKNIKKSLAGGERGERKEERREERREEGGEGRGRRRGEGELSENNNPQKAQAGNCTMAHQKRQLFRVKKIKESLAGGAKRGERGERGERRKRGKENGREANRGSQTYLSVCQ
jgi:hypothetical protein